jgi:hypothetical protein
MPTRLVRLLAVLALTAAGSGCNRNCVPEPLAANARNWMDLTLPPDAHAPVSSGITKEVEAEFRRRGAAAHPEGGRPYHFLALSGGGLYGAFGVGVLNGWTEAGTRPEFDVVTGISTGALMATFAFLGPRYDQFLAENMTGLDRRDIFRLRPFNGSGALFTSRPLARKIDEYFTPELLCEVAKAHAAGRRLYVGTTNLDTRGLVIWDMGAIASRDTPESLALYKAVLLASSSVPVVFPPVRIPVEVDGGRYEELHADGGVSDTLIFRAFMVADLNRAAGRPGHWAPAGSTLWVVNNGKLYADPDCVRLNVLSVFGASGRSFGYGKTRDELYRVYLNCLETGVNFRLTAIPRELRVSTAAFRLEPEEQQLLFETGRRVGHGVLTGEGWRDLPPGTDPTEQALPRAGTRFTSSGREQTRPPTQP